MVVAAAEVDKDSSTEVDNPHTPAVPLWVTAGGLRLDNFEGGADAAEYIWSERAH